SRWCSTCRVSGSGRSRRRTTRISRRSSPSRFSPRSRSRSPTWWWTSSTPIWIRGCVMREANRSLDVASYDVRDVQEGDAARWDPGTLHVDLAAMAEVARGLPGIVSMVPSIVRPGESTRIMSVLDVVEPLVKPADPATTFPGHLGKLGVAGIGSSNRLNGLSVVSTVGPADQFDRVEGLIDMAGPGAQFSHW